MRPSFPRSRRGLTLIELIVSLAIVALLFSGVVMGVGAITGAKAKTSAGELAGTIRSLYDTATLKGKTCRLVFQLPFGKEETPTRYWAECASRALTASEDRDTELLDQTKAAEERAKLRARGQAEQVPLSKRYSQDSLPSLDELMAREKDRVDSEAKYQQFTSEEIHPHVLPAGVGVSVWTRHQRAAARTGLAFLYFFPQGYTEKAMVFLRQGSNVWTVSVAPLTGKATVVGDELEVPKS